MNYRTIGLVELNSVGMGMHTADEMVKAANVELVIVRSTCPGLFVARTLNPLGEFRCAGLPIGVF